MSNMTIQSLDRGLKILQILGKAERPLSLNEIAESFTIDRSSVFRLIATLVQSDFVRQDRETKKYSLGYRVMELAGAFGEQSRIETIIRPIMQRVCMETKQNTHLAVLDGKDVVFIAVEQPRASLTMHISVGTREPAWVTALGRALISFFDGERLDTFLSGLEIKKFTDTTVTDQTSLKERVLEARRDRIALDNEEYKPGVVCYAAPVLNNRGDVAYSVGISGSRDLIMPHQESYSEIIRNAGLEISSLLGYSEQAVPGKK
ncbi:MAG: hypothetical protein CVV44_06875 [Spirochaetae bacterium HGW-Spirochaetae-1]|jgi:IclR family pca regulon transcriptional regulator|nr:MAG: hypothetical protein CVV44_06875 [Spirochaetae bacterium HGW-Spirochaetae-1]